MRWPRDGCAVPRCPDRVERAITDLPEALANADLRRRLRGRRPAVFLDYDGTLTPIVQRPEEARLAAPMRQVLRRLAARCPVCVVSGRDRRVVQELMGMDDLVVVGSHGFEIWTPGDPAALDLGAAYRAQIERAAATLRYRLAAVPEAEVEVKHASVAAHFRRVPADRQALVRAAVDAALAASGGGLRLVPGRMVYELRPDLDWDKGKAVLHLLRSLGLDGQEVVALYLGDDLTDEDAFRALAGRGIGVLVGDPADPELAGRTTWAHYRLRDVPEVQHFLDQLADWIDDRGVARP